jgi:hypothetical protein
MKIDAVDFADDTIGYIEKNTRPELLQFGCKVATVHYRDFITDKPRKEETLIYFKCLPEIVDKLTHQHIDQLLGQVRSLFLSDKLSLRSKVVAITSTDFLDGEINEKGL